MSLEDWLNRCLRLEGLSDSSIGIEYECLRCGRNVTHDDLAAMPELKCPHCGYKILKKARPTIVKHVKAQ